MARTRVRQTRRAVTPGRKSPAASIKPGPGTAADALALLTLVLVAAVTFGFYPEAREWASLSLGYGWLPALAWVAGVAALIRYWPRSVLRRWRWVVGGAALAVFSVGLLSLVPAGAFGETTLSGEWGRVVGGEPPLGLVKLAIIALVTPVVLFPVGTARRYWRGLQRLGAGLQLAAVYAYTGVLAAGRFAIAPFRALRDWRRRCRELAELNWLPDTPAREPGETSRALARVTAPPAAPRRLEPEPDFFRDEPEDSPNLWGDAEPGKVPEMEQESRAPAVFNGNGRSPAFSVARLSDHDEESDRESAPTAGAAMPQSQWGLPSMDLLAPPEPHDPPEAPFKLMAQHIESALADHGVMVEVKDIKAGPRIVRFGLVPGWTTRRAEGKGENPTPAERSRVKVQAILSREKDLALSLKTPYLRIEAPVPGEALVGLEVPTPHPTKVHLRAVMETAAFQKINAKGGLPIALGQDTGGHPIVMDLTEAPHLLIAGATGSGKSVCINSIIASFLLTRPPDQLRLLMVDPKRVELTPYNGIPHLIAPVIVDPEQVDGALRALSREMSRRYRQMEELGTRNIVGYNAKSPTPMSYLVLVVDELADLMMTGGADVEQRLVRLAQLGRACGIHLALATQRPSVNVVTGLLKANIPARVAFAVASQVDSRVILDGVGAEKLLGKGDALMLNKDSPKPRRIQGALVYDEEIDRLVEFWLGQSGPPLPIISLEDEEEEESEVQVQGKLLDQARELALRNPRLSPSLLERRLKIGAQKAQQIIEELENEGLVIPAAR